MTSYTDLSDLLPSWLPWLLTGLAAIAALWVAAIGLRPLRLTAKAPDGTPSDDSAPSDNSAPSDDSDNSDSSDPSDNSDPSDPSAPPYLSVIAYSSDAARLEEFLAAMDSQTMTDREIIIVNDAGQEATAALAERHASRKGVYFTFMPVESRNVSRLKLAYTLGIKAARGEVVLTTSTDCAIPSDEWLALMAEPFRASEFTDIALGFCRFDCSRYGALRWWREFEEVSTASQWIAAALEGHPYRGDRNNLAFRRRLFFEQDGYSATNHLHTGDDDLFIAAIAEAGNTQVVLSRGSMIEYEPETASSKLWIDRQIRYRFTARWLPRRTFRMASCTRFMQWLAILGAFAGGAAGWCVWRSPWEALAGAVMLLCLWGLSIAAYRGAARRLGMTRLWWSVVPFMLWQPVAGMLFSLAHRSDRIINFTWQKPR